jgi:hypothetical protein
MATKGIPSSAVLVQSSPGIVRLCFGATPHTPATGLITGIFQTPSTPTKQRTYSALRDPNGLPWGETVVLEAECADPTGWNPTTDQWAPATVVLM